MPLIRYCTRCQRPNLDLTHCRSVDQWLCEPCIVALAEAFFEGRTTATISLVPTMEDLNATSR